MHTLKHIKNQLKTFCIAQGKPVTMHTSLRAIGKTEGGAEGLLSLLISYFTEDGGVFSVPTHTWNSNVYDRRTNDILGRTDRFHPRCQAGSQRPFSPTGSTGYVP